MTTALFIFHNGDFFNTKLREIPRKGDIIKPSRVEDFFTKDGVKIKSLQIRTGYQVSDFEVDKVVWFPMDEQTFIHIFLNG